MDARVKAVRENSLVGEGSCSIVDECMTDEEVIEQLDSLKITDPAEAVKWYVRLEDAHMDKMLDCRWGDDSDKELDIHAEWEERKSDYNG